MPLSLARTALLTGGMRLFLKVPMTTAGTQRFSSALTSYASAVIAAGSYASSAPESAAAVVMGHEQEHVSNAYQKAEKGNGQVVRASVQLKTAICPECGRTYISGGETNTQIRYYNEDNPYQKDMKESDADNKYRGANVDISA